MRQPYLNEKQHALAAIVAQPVEHFTRNEGVACSNHVNGFFVLFGIINAGAWHSDAGTEEENAW